MNFKNINDVEDILEGDIIWQYKYVTLYSQRWFEIDKDKEGYSIHGLISGHMPTWVCNGTYVKTWKTLKGIKKAIKNFAIKREWGFHNLFPQYIDKDTE